MAYMSQDGSIVNRAGKVIFFSTQRFVDDICLGDCCFICGARPEDKPFNNEHILPEWLLRRYDLFSRTITLPNDRTFRYDRYTVPCCVDCNKLMGKVICRQPNPICRTERHGAMDERRRRLTRRWQLSRSPSRGDREEGGKVSRRRAEGCVSPHWRFSDTCGAPAMAYRDFSGPGTLQGGCTSFVFV
jgi:hypothetical protein